MKNKITIEITAEGWKTDVMINGKTYTEWHAGECGLATCIEGNFEKDTEIPDNIYDALNSFFYFDCQQALVEFEGADNQENVKVFKALLAEAQLQRTR